MNAPPVRETSAPPIESARLHRHHRANVLTLTGNAEVPQDKARRTHRHRESGTHEGTTRQPSRTRSPHRHSKGQPAATPGASPSSTRRGHRRRSSERTKNAIAVVGEEGLADVTKTALSNKTQMRRRHRTKSQGGSQGCDGGRRKGGNSECHENCASRQNTNVTKVSVLFVIATCLLLIRFCLSFRHVCY
jgi:hypothetical protein